MTRCCIITVVSQIFQLCYTVASNIHDFLKHSSCCWNSPVFIRDPYGVVFFFENEDEKSHDTVALRKNSPPVLHSGESWLTTILYSGKSWLRQYYTVESQITLLYSIIQRKVNLFSSKSNLKLWEAPFNLKEVIKQNFTHGWTILSNVLKKFFFNFPIF
jgi:hypothetical protein